MPYFDEQDWVNQDHSQNKQIWIQIRVTTPDQYGEMKCCVQMVIHSTKI